MSTALQTTEIGVIPESWKVVEIGDVFKFTSGKTKPKDTKPSPTATQNIPVYGGNGILGYTSQCLLEESTLILGRVGEYCGCAHLTAPISWVTDNALLVKEEKIPIDRYFARNQFEYLNLNKYSNKMGQPLITQGIINRVKIAFPPLSEQKNIAHILSAVQRAIEAQERIIQTTTELKKALMQKLFTEGLRGETQKQTDIGLLPQSWEVKKIGEIATLKSGGTPSRKKPEYWDKGNIPWVKTGEVDYCTILDTEEKITSTGLDDSSAKLFPAGTLLMAMYGQGITRGKVALLGIEASTNQACAAFFPNEEIDTKYLYLFFEYSYDAIRNFAHGANQKNLSADIIKSFPVSYPKDKKEQQEIAQSFAVIDKKIKNAKKKKAALQDLFHTLLHELMTAKVRVDEHAFNL